MRILAVIANLVLLGFLIVTTIINSLRNLNGNDILILLLMISFPIINLIVLFKEYSGDWISLYFKRKALEEQVKINKLIETEKK